MDGDGNYDALSDGLLIIRYLFGLTGPALTVGAISPSAALQDPVAIKARLDRMKPALDFDGDGNADALTDGLLAIRYLFGLRGTSLTAGAVSPNALRATANDIGACIQSSMP